MKLFKALYNYCHYLVFGFMNIFIIVIFYIIGSNLNNNKFDAKLLSMTSFGNGADNIHLAISSKDTGTLDYKISNDVCYNYYNKRNRVKCYSKMDIQTQVVLEEKVFNTSLCSSPVYNDFDESEYLRFPMYLSDSSIKKGPLYGAKYAAYISSFTADQMLLEFGFETYADILSIHKPFKIKILDKEYLMSINNIYLNSKTQNWNKDISSYDNDYFLYFGKLNPDAVFSYSPAVFNEIDKTILCADLKTNYSHYSSLIKECLKKNDKPINLSISNNSENKIYGFSADDLSNVYTSKILVMCYISGSIMVLSVVLTLIMFEDIRRDMAKIVGVLIALFVVFAIICEIIKGLNPYNLAFLTFFNITSNICVIIFLLNLLTVALLLYKGKPEDKKVEDKVKDGNK